MSARKVSVNPSKPLTAPQEAARKKLGLVFAIDYKWYRAIEKTGTRGAQWGPLPAMVTSRLAREGLIIRMGMTVYTRENYEAVVNEMCKGETP